MLIRPLGRRGKHGKGDTLFRNKNRNAAAVGRLSPLLYVRTRRLRRSVGRLRQKTARKPESGSPHDSRCGRLFNCNRNPQTGILRPACRRKRHLLGLPLVGVPPADVLDADVRVFCAAVLPRRQDSACALLVLGHLRYVRRNRGNAVALHRIHRPAVRGFAHDDLAYPARLPRRAAMVRRNRGAEGGRLYSAAPFCSPSLPASPPRSTEPCRSSRRRGSICSI